MKPVFVQTENVRRFILTMQLVEKRIGTDSLAMIWGRAGRGKTRTARWYAIQNDCVFVESLRDWTALWMYQNILEAYGISREDIPRRKKRAFDAIVDLARRDPKPIILDEADLLGPRLIETVRDLCKMTMVPWVLIGEVNLPALMDRNRRVWSRRCATMEFQPVSVEDVIGLAREMADLILSEESAILIQKKADGGDIRLVELVLNSLEETAEANHTKEVTPKMARDALSAIPEIRR